VIVSELCVCCWLLTGAAQLYQVQLAGAVVTFHRYAARSFFIEVDADKLFAFLFHRITGVFVDAMTHVHIVGEAPLLLSSRSLVVLTRRTLLRRRLCADCARAV
jgi:hypothetical protein